MKYVSKFTLGMYAGSLMMLSPLGYMIYSQINHPPIISNELNRIKPELNKFYDLRDISKRRPSELDSIFERGKTLMIKRDSLMSLPQYKDEKARESREIELSALAMLAGGAIIAGSITGETRKKNETN